MSYRRQTEIAPEVADTRFDMRIVAPSATLLILIVIWSIFFPETAEKIMQALYGPFAKNTGVVYLWATLAMIALTVFFACSRYGNIRFGEPGEKAEFSNYSWMAMMFTSGVAGAVLFWSFVEPTFNLAYPPQYAEPLSREAYDWSLSYVLLHWGPVTWPWYAITALPICYMFYRLKRPVLRISAVAEPVIGKKATDGWAGKTIEVFFIVGLIFSNTAVMGVSLPLVAHALGALLGIEPSFGLQVVILAVSACIFTASVTLGLKKGIKILSSINVSVAIAMIVYVLFVGPTVQIMESFTNSVGVMTNNFIGMLFWTSPWEASTFPQDWTIFYALWMASYGPFMGLFIARISRGRNVRQVLLWTVFGGMAGSFFIHGVFGSYALNAQKSGLVDAVGILTSNGPQGGAMALIAYLQSIPGGVLMLIGYCICSTVFLATSVDSCAYIMSCAATRKLTLGTEPTTGNRFFWAFIQAGLALAVISLGGMGAAKIFANFAGALMLIPIAIAVVAWFKFVKRVDLVEEERRNDATEASILADISQKDCTIALDGDGIDPDLLRPDGQAACELK